MKTKRFAMVVVALLVVLSLMIEISPVFALPEIIRPLYPWKINYIDQSHNISSISMILNETDLKPQTFYYINDSQTFHKATLVGEGSGNCGTQNAWECLWTEIVATVGEFNDSSYHIGAAGKTFLSGLVYFDPIFYRLTYREVSGTDPAVTAGIIDFDSLDGTVTPRLAYGPNASPHIVALLDRTSGTDQLVYIRRHVGPEGSCATPPWGGSNLWDCDVIKEGFSVARDPSIAVDDAGDIHVAYYDPFAHNLVYATNARGAYNCGNQNGWHCATIESVGDTGAFPSIAAAGGPSIAFYNRTTGKLRLAKWVGLGGTGANCGWDSVGLEEGNTFLCEEIDSIGNSRSQVAISLVLDLAEPVIAYSEAAGSLSRLKLAQRNQRIGSLAGNCGEVDPGDLFQHWQCDLIDQGPYNMGGEIDLAVKPSGLASIAYLENNDAEMQNHLLVAYQYIPKKIYLPMLKR